MKLRIAAIAILFLVAPARAQEDTQDSVFINAAAKFYEAYVRLGVRGLPDDATRAKLAPTITWSLEQELKAALEVQKKFAAEMKGEVPPLVDGDLFTSLFEGATSFEIRACKRMAAGASCVVTLTYAEKDGKRTKWNDFAELREEKSGWHVDNIGYGGDWPFANKGTLKQTLKAAVAGLQ